MSEMGDGARAYIQFLNQTIAEIQKLFRVELNKDEQMTLRIALSNAIGSVITDEVVER